MSEMTIDRIDSTTQDTIRNMLTEKTVRAVLIKKDALEFWSKLLLGKRGEVLLTVHFTNQPSQEQLITLLEGTGYDYGGLQTIEAAVAKAHGVLQQCILPTPPLRF